jgi:hypothetical protein
MPFKKQGPAPSGILIKNIRDSAKMPIEVSRRCINVAPLVATDIAPDVAPKNAIGGAPKGNVRAEIHAAKRDEQSWALPIPKGA